MLIRELFLPEFAQEMANTRKILEKVPDGNFDYKPHTKSMPLGRLAGHVAELPTWATTTVETEELNMDGSQKPYTATTRQKLLEDFDKNVAAAKAALSNVSDEHLAKTWTFKYMGKTIMAMPRHAVLRSVVLNHIIHHRSQLGVYLRLNEIEIPGMYGPSADEVKFWEAPKTSTAT